MNLKPQYVVDAHGKRVAVILDIPSYEQMIEDLDDLRTIAARRKEPSLPLPQFAARLKSRGLL